MRRRVLARGVVMLLVPLIVAASVPRVERFFFGVRAGVTFMGQEVAGMLPAEVRAMLAQRAAALYVAPEDAHLDERNGEVVPEKEGRQLDAAATAANLLSALPGTAVEPVFLRVEPRINAKLVRRLTKEIATYATTLYGSPARVNNIRLAAARINYQLVLPGETFSFWGVVGEPTYAQGYQDAPIIVGQEFVPGIGGGICQVSSTLYNAALKAGLEVIERHGHSRPVDYVPPGRDATVFFDSLDFKFRNDADGPLIVRAGISNGWQLRVWFLAEADDQAS